MVAGGAIHDVYCCGRLLPAARTVQAIVLVPSVEIRKKATTSQ